ncbi:MAG: ABC transporter permease subunit [Euryarchaeota archaeon]|nr:ABC transporter permease subunit [Euryarchaeota archaeon]
MKNSFLFILLLFSILMMLFILIPILVLYSFVPFFDFIIIFSNRSFLETINVTFLAGLISTFLIAILGIPLGYLMARTDFPGKNFVQGLIDLPLVVPDTVAGLIIFLTFYSQGILGAPLSRAGINFVNTLYGIVVAMMFVGAPFMINTSKSGFLSVDPKLERVSLSLGASKISTFFNVTLPLSLDSIVNGLVMTWAKGVSSFGSIIVIAYFPMVAPTYIYNQFLLFGTDASAIAAGAFLLITLIIFAISRFITTKMMRWLRK